VGSRAVTDLARKSTYISTGLLKSAVAFIRLGVAKAVSVYFHVV
jgi:hypothetical protein